MNREQDTSGAVHRCPVCEKPMYVDQEWRLRKGLAVGEPATDGDYVHADCWEEDDDR